MATPFTGEIQIFGFDFAPRDWATCDGSLLRIQQHTALYSLIGVTYGGDGRTTFAVPAISGGAVCSTGQGPGLSNRGLGQQFGADKVTLTQAQMPVHVHALNTYGVRGSAGKVGVPQAGAALTPPGRSKAFVNESTASEQLFHPSTIGVAGGSTAHENRQPFLAMRFCIATNGVFPQFD